MPHRRIAAAATRAATRATGRLGWLRGALGALLGIAFAGVGGHLATSAGPAALPWLLAPIGASAVLVFALPASPLAQPWPVAGGNLLSATIGVVLGLLVPSPLLAAALAVGAAIGVMSLCRCLHPPGGACALLGALSAPLVQSHGAGAVLLPLTLNVSGLLVTAWLYNNLTGHRWPHRMEVAPPSAPEPMVATYTADDLDAVIDEWDEVLDVSREDLDALFRAVERRVRQRAEISG